MPVINGKYYTDEEVSAIKRQSSSSDFEKFLISGVVGFAVGSSVVGGLLGGSFLGGFVGYLIDATFELETLPTTDMQLKALSHIVYDVDSNKIVKCKVSLEQVFNVYNRSYKK
jgi:hypothetical protein